MWCIVSFVKQQQQGGDHHVDEQEVQDAHSQACTSSSSFLSLSSRLVLIWDKYCEQTVKEMLLPLVPLLWEVQLLCKLCAISLRVEEPNRVETVVGICNRR